MRVLWFVNTEFPEAALHYGRAPRTGAGSWMKSLCSAMRADSTIELHVACASPLYREGECFKENDVHYHSIPRPKYRHYLPATSKDVDASAQLVRRVAPDLVHVFGTEQFYGLIAPRVEVPVLIRMQGILANCVRWYWGGLAHTLSARYPEMLRSLVYLASRVRQEQRILGCNRWFEGQSQVDEAWVKAGSQNTSYFRNAAMLREPFYHTDWVASRAEPYHVFALAPTLPFKGAHVLVKAASILVRDYPRLRLVFGGARPRNGYARYVERLIGRADLNDNVEWLGELNEQKLAEALRAAALFVQPSFVENESLLRLEALAVGTPCIASYAGGMPTATGDVQRGAFFPPGDHMILAQQIRAYFESPDELAKLGETMRSEIRRYLDPGHITKRTHEIYDLVTAGHTQGKQQGARC